VEARASLAGALSPLDSVGVMVACESSASIENVQLLSWESNLESRMGARRESVVDGRARVLPNECYQLLDHLKICETPHETFQ
jgi:hypothetical protein